jgi:hypothetical protein
MVSCKELLKIVIITLRRYNGSTYSFRRWGVVRSAKAGMSLLLFRETLQVPVNQLRLSVREGTGI